MATSKETAVSDKAAKARKAATAYAAKEQSSNKPKGLVGVPCLEPASTTDDLFSKICSALDTPVIHPVLWSPEVPETHPIRNLDLYVQLWGAAESERYWQLNKLEQKRQRDIKVACPNKADEEYAAFAEKDKRPNYWEMQLWEVIAWSTCDKSGRLVFADSDTPAEPSLWSSWSERLKAKFNNSKSLPAMLCLFDSALMLNGHIPVVENRDAKNSEVTDPSTASCE